MKIINKYVLGQGINITTMPRSGSTYLQYLLTTVFNDNVEFIHETRNDGDKHQIDIYNKYYRENLKTISNDFQNFICKTFTRGIKMDYCAPINGSYNVFLVRTDLFESTLSHIYARMTGMYLNNNTHLNPITIPLSTFNQFLKMRKNKIDDLLKNIYKVKYDLILTYEELTFKTDIDLKNMDMLKQKEYNSTLKPFPNKHTYIINYNELKKHFDDIKHTIKINNATVENGIITDFTIQHQGE